MQDSAMPLGADNYVPFFFWWGVVGRAGGEERYPGVLLCSNGDT